MKLIRWGDPENERPGVILENKRIDLSEFFKDWDRDFFNNDGLKKLGEVLKEQTGKLKVVEEKERWASCVARPGKVLCIGLNYSDHAIEAGMEIPGEPILFQKGSNTVVGPYDPIIIPRNSSKTDWEVELGIIIGKDARYLGSEGDARSFVAGFCISHDVSERAFQLEHGGQWTKGKSCDNFNPIGPWMATSYLIEDVNNLRMTLHVNGEKMQDGNTATMIFKWDFLIYYLSQFMTLEAGDLITTGTPPGVGMGKKPSRYLRAGDVVELSVEGLGRQHQVCIDAT
jgi:2-keto-4-pentenoate hydratase/2-oxohepta-3-ene-1,7-dioic acid hydratase in catechol pathway